MCVCISRVIANTTISFPHSSPQNGGTPKPPEAKKAKKPAWKYVDLPIASLTPSASKKDIVDLREIEVITELD